MTTATKLSETRKWARLAIRLARAQKRWDRRDARLRLIRTAAFFETPEQTANRLALRALGRRDFATEESC